MNKEEKMKKRMKLGLFLPIALMLIVSGCSFSSSSTKSKSETKQNASADNGKQILRTNNGSEPGSLHPGTAQGSHDSWILEHIFEGLTTKTPEGKIIPGMAEKWEMSDDGLVWTFQLKDGVKWSNGDPVTAEDFRYAWMYALNPNTASQYAYQLYYIKGAESLNAIGAEERAKAKEEKRDPVPVSDEQMEEQASAVGIKAIDEQTLEVTLEKPVPYFLDLTSHYTYYPINKKVQEQNPEWYHEAEYFVSNGPFKLTEWRHNEKLTLAKNEFYYGKDQVKLDEVQLYTIEDLNTAWQLFKSGELDLLEELPAEVTGDMITKKDPEFHNAADLSTYYFNLNTNVKPFNNAKIRKAMSMALDRKTITEHVAQGGQMPAYGIIPPGMPDVEGDFRENGGDLFKEDLKEAKKLFEEGLREEGLKKLPKITLLYNTSDNHKAIAEAAQEMWRKNLGIDQVVLENVEMQVKLDREQGGEYMISRAGWIGDYVDPMTYLDLWVTEGPYNDSRWSNKKYDALIKKAKSSMDPNVRMAAMHEAEQILMDEMPVIPVYYYTKPHAIKEYVSGIYTPINRQPQFRHAEIKK